MARQPIWKAIYESLTAEIAQGHYPAGSKLPTEAQLAARFGVNRHTVRRALGEMAQAGLVRARRGAGVFVELEPTEYPLGKRVRFHQNLQAAGRVAEREVLALETRFADPTEAEHLGLAAGASVHVYRAISFADRAPINLSTSIFPSERFPNLLLELKETPSITKALASNGVADYTRAQTKITAEPATVTQALQLKVNEGAPLLRTAAVNHDMDGKPVEFGQSWWAADRVTLTLGEE